jgi:hypothetical protein
MGPHPSSASWRAILVLVFVIVATVTPNIATAQESLDVQISIEEAIFVNGAVVVSGTVTCSQPTTFIDVFVEVRRPIGPNKSQVGTGSDSPGPCTGAVPFSVLVAPSAGRFRAGTVFIVASAFGCTTQVCDGDSDAEVMDLRR